MMCPNWNRTLSASMTSSIRWAQLDEEGAEQA